MSFYTHMEVQTAFSLLIMHQCTCLWNRPAFSPSRFFYGKAEVEFECKKFVSPPIIDINSLTMQEMKEMESDSNYSTIFPETFKLMNILLTLPLGTASVERSFSQMKMIKTRLYNRLTDVTLE